MKALPARFLLIQWGDGEVDYQARGVEEPWMRWQTKVLLDTAHKQAVLGTIRDRRSGADQ